MHLSYFVRSADPGQEAIASYSRLLHFFRKNPSYLAHRNVTGKPEGSFSTLNVPMQNWMQNSHAAITGHKSGRGVTRDAFWTMCPIHKGWGQRGKALLGVHKKCLAFNTQTRATPPQPLTGVCYSGQQTGNEIPQKWPPATVGGKGLSCERAGRPSSLMPYFCWAATVPMPTGVPRAAEQGSAAACLGCCSSTEEPGSSSCSPS